VPHWWWVSPGFDIGPGDIIIFGRVRVLGSVIVVLPGIGEIMKLTVKVDHLLWTTRGKFGLAATSAGVHCQATDRIGERRIRLRHEYARLLR
jgi:hypothetical protein